MPSECRIVTVRTVPSRIRDWPIGSSTAMVNTTVLSGMRRYGLTTRGVCSPSISSWLRTNRPSDARSACTVLCGGDAWCVAKGRSMAVGSPWSQPNPTAV